MQKGHLFALTYDVLGHKLVFKALHWYSAHCFSKGVSIPLLRSTTIRQICTAFPCFGSLFSFCLTLSVVLSNSVFLSHK